MSSIVFTFGRFNPPTTGHERLIQKLVETAKFYSADHAVYLSQSQNNKSDPLSWDFKTQIFKAAFPGVKVSTDREIKTPFQALEKLSETYNHCIMVVGSDQLQEFSTRMAPYADKWNTTLDVISAGQRLAESIDIDGMSATKMRQYALDENKEMFLKGLPSRLSPSLKSHIYEKTVFSLKS